MDIESTDRRTFMISALASASMFATPSPGQAPEVRNYVAEIPAGATLWGLIAFTADEPVEITVSAGQSLKSIRGRFDGQRFAEYVWQNGSSQPQRVAVRAKALAGERELPPTKVQFLSQENVYVGFGRRAIPAAPEARRGGYPYEAVFVGFFVFG